MSDTGRQSLTDKAGAALKVWSCCSWMLDVGTNLLAVQPDSEKSTTEHLGDKFKGNADSLGSSVQPQVSAFKSLMRLGHESILTIS